MLLTPKLLNCMSVLFCKTMALVWLCEEELKRCGETEREKYYNSFVPQGVEYVLAHVNKIKVLTKNN